MRTKTLPLFLLCLSVSLAAWGCSSREGTPVAGEDSTLVYRSKSTEGIEASITFCSRISKKTGKPLGAGSSFVMEEDAKVRALVYLRGMPPSSGRELLFHLVWTGPDGKEFYTKRIPLVSSGEPAELETSISIPPSRRDPGMYALEVYLFRERIAEKSFELRAS